MLYTNVLLDSKTNVISIKTFNASSSPLKSLFLNLRPSTTYEVSVEAVVILNEVDKTTNETKEIVHKSLPTTLTSHTSPKPPHSLRLVKVGYSNVSLAWSAPNTGIGETIVEYLVKYNTMDTNGSRSVQGTEKIQSALTKTYFEITGLAMGFLYGVSVKVSYYRISNMSIILHDRKTVVLIFLNFVFEIKILYKFFYFFVIYLKGVQTILVSDLPLMGVAEECWKFSLFGY